MMERFRVTDEDGGVRIDKYLTSVCEGLSRSYLQKLLKSGQVLVGGQGVKASYAVQEGDLIELEVPEAVEPEILAEPMDLDVLYEDEDIILINKPKGMVVHPAAGHYNHTLVNGLAIVSGIICDGAVRSGKTLCMSLSFVSWAFYRFRDTAFALCGKTVASLRRNVLTPLTEQLTALGFTCTFKISRR